MPCPQYSYSLVSKLQRKHHCEIFVKYLNVQYVSEAPVAPERPPSVYLWRYSSGKHSHCCYLCVFISQMQFCTKVKLLNLTGKDTVVIILNYPTSHLKYFIYRAFFNRSEESYMYTYGEEQQQICQVVQNPLWAGISHPDKSKHKCSQTMHSDHNVI